MRKSDYFVVCNWTSLLCNMLWAFDSSFSRAVITNYHNFYCAFSTSEVNSQLFLKFLTNLYYIEDLPASLKYESWIQMDGAYFGIDVRD